MPLVLTSFTLPSESATLTLGSHRIRLHAALIPFAYRTKLATAQAALLPFLDQSQPQPQNSI